jgi:hypothetical protein
VEVGNGNGALILFVGDSFRDREIEVSPVGSTARVHTGVLERRTAAGSVLAAVFGSLPAGRYVVWGDKQAALDEVVIASGGVTEWAGRSADTSATVN